MTLLALVLLAAVAVGAPGALAGIYSGGALRAAPPARGIGDVAAAGGLAMLFHGVGFVLGAALRGLGDVAWPTAIQVAVAAALVPSAWWLAIGRGGGASGLVAAILATSLLRAVLLAARLRHCASPTGLAQHLA